MIIQQIRTGIRAHWHIRLSEWIMVYPAALMGAALLLQPAMFSTSPSFDTVAGWGPQARWSVFVLACAVVRLVALVVNGTFESFRYSPHLRLLASVAGIAFWSQFTLGFITSAWFDGGAWSGPIAYSTLCLCELANFYRSWKDIFAGMRKP